MTNKKEWIIVGIFLSVVAIVIIGGFFGIKKWMDDKEPITSEEFNSYLEKEGFEVTEINRTTGMKKVLSAKDKIRQIEVNYYQIQDEKKAEALYRNLVNHYDSYTENSYKRMTLDFIIYQKYRLVTNGQAVGLLRIKDTIIQVETYEKNEKYMKKILKELD